MERLWYVFVSIVVAIALATLAQEAGLGDGVAVAAIVAALLSQIIKRPS